MKVTSINEYKLSQYYWKLSVKSRIVSYTKGRAMDFIESKASKVHGITTRCMKCECNWHFDYLMRELKMCKGYGKIFNLYYSMLDYGEKGISNQSMNLKERDTSKFDKNHWKSAVGMDFFIDIDIEVENLDIAFEQALKIKRFFDELRMPHFFRFSGKGFHFVVPHEVVNGVPEGWQNFNPDEIGVIDAYYYAAKFFYDNFSEMVDLSIYDYRRVLKIPYSLAIYKDRVMVCLPVMDKTIRSRKFDASDYEFRDDINLEDYPDTLHNANAAASFDLGNFGLAKVIRNEKEESEGKKREKSYN